MKNLVNINTVSTACVIGAAFTLANGNVGWGWFLLVAVLLAR
jgi:hypothetical protein